MNVPEPQDGVFVARVRDMLADAHRGLDRSRAGSGHGLVGGPLTTQTVAAAVAEGCPGRRSETHHHRRSSRSRSIDQAKRRVQAEGECPLLAASTTMSEAEKQAT